MSLGKGREIKDESDKHVHVCINNLYLQTYMYWYNNNTIFQTKQHIKLFKMVYVTDKLMS